MVMSAIFGELQDVPSALNVNGNTILKVKGLTGSHGRNDRNLNSTDILKKIT